MIRAAGLATLCACGCLAAGASAGPAGRSLFAETFADGVPFPFAALLERLETLAGPENVQTALVPVGRSLQRYAAAPDLFDSPRLVVAVTGDLSAGPTDARLADRLFIGFQPAADAVEAISYDAATGRFEFEEIVGYAADDRAIEPARREICATCHQGEAPIFPRPLWDETNASAEVAAGLSGLGAVWNGAPVAQTVDALEAFDAAVRRAGRVELANRLWAEGCPDPACRAELLIAALDILLIGPTADAGIGASFSEHAAALWPDGIALVPGDLPNRDPSAATGDPLETEGDLNPATPRRPEIVWHPGPGAFAAAAEEIAAAFSPGDAAWIESLLAARPADSEEIRIGCETENAAGETRFTCASGPDLVQGFSAPDGRGRIELARIGGLPPLRRVATREGDTGALRPERPARLADGRRLAAFRPDGTMLLVDDLRPLSSALTTAARHAPAGLDAGPFRRSDVLALIGSLIGSADG